MSVARAFGAAETRACSLHFDLRCKALPRKMKPPEWQPGKASSVESPPQIGQW
jgi:hypothetical protein